MIEVEDRGIKAIVVKDSISDLGCRLTTLQLRYPRFIHAQLMTHRVFSRNARSSRATPVSVNIDMVRNDPAYPLFWGKNKRGMQPKDEEVDTWDAEVIWGGAGIQAARYAEQLADLGLHKQIANRVLEPFMWIDTLVTATEFSNWDALRDHDEAQKAIAVLARVMKEARNRSVPVNRTWHIPYVDADMPGNANENIKCGVARCARVSHKPFDSSTANVQKDINLYKQLLNGSDFGHWSPFEHVAVQHNFLYDYPYEDGSRRMHYAVPIRSGNFRGWIQHRKMHAGECL